MCVSTHNCQNVWFSNKYAGRFILWGGGLSLFQNLKKCHKVLSHIQKNGKQMLMQLIPLTSPKPHFYWLQWDHSCVCTGWGVGSRISLFNNLQSCSISPSWITAQSQKKKNRNAFSLNMTEHMNSTFSQLGFNFLNVFERYHPFWGCSSFWFQNITENFKLFRVTA